MSEPDIEKKKKRRRSARVYLSNAHPLPSPEQLAALVDQFPSDEDDDQAVAKPDRVKRRISQAERKRIAREGNAVVNPDGHISYPIENTEDLHNAAVLARTGHGDVEAARRLIARRAKELGVKNPLESSEKATGGNAHTPPGGRSPFDRVSPPLTAGHQSPSSGDHGADPMRPVGPRQAAFEHRDLRQQSSTTVLPWQMLSTANGDNEFGDRSITHPRGTAHLSQLQQPDIAGFRSQLGDNAPSGNPNLHGADHQSRGSATPATPGHSLSDPSSHAVAMKSSDALRIMRETQNRGRR